jgi:hypothetical protein
MILKYEDQGLYTRCPRLSIASLMLTSCRFFLSGKTDVPYSYIIIKIGIHMFIK